MRGALRFPSAVGIAVLLVGWAGGDAHGQSVSQSFTLRPGWNSIYLEVDPAQGSPEVVFSNLPVVSVWTHAQPVTSATFIQDVSEKSFNRAEWLVWFPPKSPESILANLHAVTGNRAYLLKTTNSTPLNWTLTGRPSSRRIEWVPDAFNLRGFPVNETSPPSFLNFFRPSTAHYDAGSGQLQKIYRLSSSGQWTLVSPSDAMRRGEACWVFSKGASDYAGPMEAQPVLEDGVNFDAAAQELTVELKNRTGTAQTVTLTTRSATANNALAYRTFQPAKGGYQWTNLPAVHVLTVPAQETHQLRLGIRRGAFSTKNYSAVLEIANGVGTKSYLPVSATRPLSPNQTFQGLWVGGATVTSVNEVNINPTNLTPVQVGFPMRLLIHVDSQGRPRFLKEVIQMWRDGTSTNDANGYQVMQKSGDYVLLTDDRLLGQFKGATLRDGVPVGRRLSTAAFDFDGGTSNSLAMSGSFGIGSRLAANIALGPNSPTNPFRHKYHPDHDNLDGRFVPLTNNFEAYPVTRSIELEFTSTDPTGASTPDFGYSVMGGIYRETLTGLHKAPIRVQGTFQLIRTCYTGVLNPNPLP